MNKVNLCWVFTDGRQGHDIQSLTLANAISDQVEAHAFSLSQPWLALAPRLLPWMKHGIQWHNQQPDWSATHPQLIITAGRRAAAVGRFITNQLRTAQLSCRHIQILNPHGNPAHYDLLLVPEHDLCDGPQMLSFRGSIHPYTRQWHSQQQDTAGHGQYLALMLGQPGTEYWSGDFSRELNIIRTAFSGTPLFLCGSPRLAATASESIKTLLHSGDRTWFSDADGINPYLSLLAHAQKIFVTADSINMVNEALASPRPKSLLAINAPTTARHRRFIEQVAADFCALEERRLNASPIDTIDQILQHPKLAELINQA